MQYTEFETVEKPIIEWLEELGWKYVPHEDLRRGSEEPFDLHRLTESIKRLNPAIVHDNSDVEKIVNQLRRMTRGIIGNREFFEWLKGERSIVLQPGKKAETVRLIDFDNADNNMFVVTNQFEFSGIEDVRFDVVLMVNGIPLVVIEAKAPTRISLDYRQAIKQILRYHEQAPQFFKYLALACATDGIDFRYDWVTRNRYFEWKKKEYDDPLQNSVMGLFRRDFFLDFIGNFIVFEKEREKVTKKIAMYQQAIAANKIVERVLAGDKRNGLIWHTQGSGKSLTMLFAAWKLKKAPQLCNPTILLIVDRIDLERQLWGCFSNVDLPYTSKALSTKNLMKKLKQDSREVIITTIQKFERIDEVLSERENIIIFVDEAHRSQYGKLAVRMRTAFPNASIYGFTGTPIDKGPLGKSTFRTFCPPGEVYIDKYSITQSIEDGATVRLVYQPRLAKYHVPKELLDKGFLEITRDRTEDEQEKILRKSAKLRTALKAQKRIDMVAKDVAEHYQTHIEPNGFKAQLVAVDREACALYKEALDKHLPPEYSTVIYTAGQNDDAPLRKYHMEKEKQLIIARISFQNKDENPKILIVTDMLLTGFDAPIEQVMYLDKPLRDHKLLQAIARTNRPYPGKEAGIIVDYVGIFSRLVKALNFQEEDVEGVAYNYDVLKTEFEKLIASLLSLFKGIKRDGTRESLLASVKRLEDEVKLKEFKSGLTKLRRLYETVAPDPFLSEHLDGYTWLIAISEAYNKVMNRGKPDLTEYEEKTKQLIKEKLIVEELEKELPVFEIDGDYLKNLKKKGYTGEEKVMELQQALEHHIKINLELNPFYETLGERMERILKSKDSSHLIREMQKLVEEITEIEEKAKEIGLTREEHALVNVMKEYETSLSESQLVSFVRELLKEIKPKLFENWHKKLRVGRNVAEAIFGFCHEKFRGTLDTNVYLDMSDELMKFVVRYNP